MRKFALPLLVLCLASFTSATVSVSAPANGSTVSPTVQFVATATTTCADGVSAMGIYTAPGSLAYTVSGDSLNTLLTLNPGTYDTVVEEWDNCGGSSSTPVTITVGGGSSSSGVTVTAPKNNSTVATTVQYVASATTSCDKGVASMGIYTSPGVRAYLSNGASLNTTLTLNPGTYNTVVQEWDNCGGSSSTPVTITAGGSSGGSGVTVTAPTPNSSVSSSVQYVASATTTCSKGVSAMGIYTAPGVLAYTGAGASLNTNITLGTAGTYQTTVQEWDNCGGSASTPVTITVDGGSTESSFSSLQEDSGWTGYGLLAPSYNICSSCSPSGPQVAWGMTQNVSSPSLSGHASEMWIGGDTAYSDVLWNNHLIGNFSSQGLPDTGQTLVPTLHNFIYDVYFYIDNASISQALEFDINEFVGGESYIWGHECRIAGGNEWDVWDDTAGAWHPTGVACNPLSNAWNHLTIQVQRTSDNQLLFQSITLNGDTANINYYGTPTPTSWYGVTINYQQDGNYQQNGYSVWLDNLTFTYW
jgi:major membrane immunogen (membrane-anchored lipoprotein)